MTTINASNVSGEPVFRLFVKERLPSWNTILAMGFRKRHHLKQGTQAAFLSALRATDNDSVTRTTFVKNTLSIAAATLASFLTTRRIERRSKSARSRSEARTPKAR